jgi:aminoglycoside phosphotransferase (APT) family kinase protein
MERVDGIILRTQVPPGVTLDAPTMRDLSSAWLDTLVAIHAVDVEACGLSSLGRGEDYAARQVKGWTERYWQARSDDVVDIEKTAEWLAANVPPAAGRCLIHNDYKYDNLVLNPHRLADLRAVLDWEMATIGDPLMDLGTSLGYWVEANDPEDVRTLPFGLTALAGNMTRAEIVEQYAARSGRSVAQAAFYHAFGLFKIAVVVQQIYFRYKQGKTQDPRFAHLGHAVRILGRQAQQVIRSG